MNGIVLFAVLTLAVLCCATGAARGDEDRLRKAVTLYASFDSEVRGDFGGGELALRTRFGPPGKGPYTFKDGHDATAFRIAKNKGITGGALECVDVLPDNGRLFFPAKGNLAFRQGGWGGAVSMWLDTDPDELLKTTFCDPVQITQKGANNGGIWFDFNNAKPKRDLRLGAFPAVADRQPPLAEDAPDAPLVRVPEVGFKAGVWHHVVLSWEDFDTGRPGACVTLYIDGKRAGEIRDRALAMDWELDQAGIYVAVNYIGLIDEFAVFGRSLSEDEVALLRDQPGVLGALKKK